MNLLGVSWEGNTYLIDSQTGEYQYLSSIPYNLNDLARSPDGKFFSIGSVSANSTTAPLIQIDPTTGNHSIVGHISGLPTISHGLGTYCPEVVGMAFASDGGLFVTTYGSTTLFRVDMSTLSASAVGDMNRSATLALAFSNDGQLYGNAYYRGLIQINTQNADTIEVNPDQSAQDPASAQVPALTFLSDGQLLGISDSPLYSPYSYLLSLDIATGYGSDPRPMSGLPDIRGIAELPEPASLMLLMLGGLAVLPRGRR